MDPNANLSEQDRILATNDYRGMVRAEADRLRELRGALREWLERGGFAPEWARYPRARAYYGK